MVLRLLKEDFKRSYGVFQQDGLAIAANYSVLNFQAPNREWKKVRKLFIDLIRSMSFPGG